MRGSRYRSQLLRELHLAPPPTCRKKKRGGTAPVAGYIRIYLQEGEGDFHRRCSCLRLPVRAWVSVQHQAGRVFAARAVSKHARAVLLLKGGGRVPRSTAAGGVGRDFEVPRDVNGR